MMNTMYKKIKINGTNIYTIFHNGYEISFIYLWNYWYFVSNAFQLPIYSSKPLKIQFYSIIFKSYKLYSSVELQNLFHHTESIIVNL